MAESELPFTDELNDPDVCYFIDGGIPRECGFQLVSLDASACVTP